MQPHSITSERGNSERSSSERSSSERSNSERSSSEHVVPEQPASPQARPERLLPEQQPYWGELLGKAKSTNLRDLARHYGLFTAELQAALERTGSLTGANGQPTPAESAAKGPGGRANQKLEASRQLLGVIPDGEVAKRLDVARKTVVAFRKKHNIPRYRGPGAMDEDEETSEERQVAPLRSTGAPGAATSGTAFSGAAAAVTATSVTGRASKLDGYLDIIGKLPDREVADRSGMTTENVRMYRQRRNIPAEWRGESWRGESWRGEGLRGESWRGEGSRQEEAVAAPAARIALAPSSGRLVYEIRARRGEERGRFALLAADPVEAAQRAQAALALREPGWVIRAIRLVAEALPE